MASREVLSFRPATASVDRALHKGRCVPASLSQAEPLRLTQLPIGAPRMRRVAWCWQQLAPVATWPRSLQQQGPFWKLPACAPPHAPPSAPVPLWGTEEKQQQPGSPRSPHQHGHARVLPAVGPGHPGLALVAAPGNGVRITL